MKQVFRAFRRRLGAVLPLALAALTALTAPAGGSPADPRLLLAVKGETIAVPDAAGPALTPEALAGTWRGSLPMRVGRTENVAHYVLDAAELSFDPGREPALLIATESMDWTYLPPNEWALQDGEARFTLNDAPWLASVTLRLRDENTLVGSIAQYGRERELSFTRIVPAEGEEPLALKTQLVFEGKTGPEWTALLQAHPGYTQGGAPIGFTYELGERTPIFTQYRLDQLMETTRGYRDVDRMKAVLDLVCDRFPHDGAVTIPEGGLSPQEAIDWCNQNGAIECRGLSAILSEMLRECGIPAKAVMCIPAVEPSEDCHVVVQAYSYDVGRWVLLDPTYHLMLRTQGGTYVNLRMLRDALITGETLVPNEDAGHNGMPFSMEYYRAYMAKNTFRFSCPVNNAFGAKDNVDGNRVYMLAPAGWEVPYRWSRPEQITTSADDFWAPPPPQFGEDAGAAPLPEGTDCFMMEGKLYYNASDVAWAATKALRQGEVLGEISHTGVQQESLGEWEATVLPAGTKIYRCVGSEVAAVVIWQGKLVPYLRLG